MPSKPKYIIDTDLGDDVDDALALALAATAQMELVAVTTVYRNVEDRARMAKKLLSALGEPYGRVPVLPGHSWPLERNLPAPAIDFLSEEERTDLTLAPDGASPDEAVDALIHACHTYGKDLTVVALGPLTNLARVIERDPTALPTASRVVLMGGAYFRHYADWNVSCDPHAAATVFASLPNLECIGADVTHAAVAPCELEERLLHPTPAAPRWRHYLADLTQRWLSTRAKPALVLHDPLLMAYLLEPTLCHFTETSVCVVTDGPAAGLTLNLDVYSKQWMNEAYTSLPPPPRHRVACDVNLERFWKIIEKMLTE